MGVFARSWSLTKLSFRVIKQDKEMLLFPLLAGFFSLAYSAALLVPTIVIDIIEFMNAESSGQPEAIAFGVLEYVLLFVSYVGLAFIATFFNVCVVFTTKTRFEGGDATFMDSIRFAMSRIHLIFTWSLIAATVGIILRGLESLAERVGGIGAVLLNILRSVLGVTWTVVTLFVVPAMVYHGVGPREAIKKSVETLRETWGESLVRHFGLGFIQMIFFVLGIALVSGLAFVLVPAGGVGVIALIVIAFVYFLGLISVFNVANMVFNTALYAYAQTSTASGDFDEATLQAAFKSKN